MELDIEAWQDGEDEEEWEVVRSEKSLMKRALQRYGSRDVSAQLFTALCRALGIPARLVVSLQSMPWQAGVGKPKTKPKPKTKDAKGKGKEKEKERASVDGEEDAEEDGGMEEVDIPSTGGYFPGDGQMLDTGSSSTAAKVKGKGKEKAKPVIRLRKSKSKGQTLASSRPPSAFLSLDSMSVVLTFCISCDRASRSNTHSTYLLDRGILSCRCTLASRRPYPCHSQ